MNTKLNIKIILGSTRQGRFSEKPAAWLMDMLKGKEGIEASILDLRDFPMPFFEETMSPSMIKEPYTNPVVVKWTAEIASADGFIVIAPEYNHGYTAVLKNALDYVGKEWHRKAVGFVGYGSVMGSRAIEQLRQVVIELKMAPIGAAIHIPSAVYLAALKEGSTAFSPLQEGADKFIDQLVWWTKALKTAREQK